MHDRWINYRWLAEAFRSAIFISLASVGHAAQAPELMPHEHPWFQRAFSEAWQHRPLVAVTDADAEALGLLIVGGWLDDQIDFYRTKAKAFARARILFRRAISVMAAVTIVIAVVHISGAGEGTWLPKALEFAAIVLPAFGAAVAGVRAQGQHRFHEERSQHAAMRLERLRARAQTHTGLDGYGPWSRKPRR